MALTKEIKEQFNRVSEKYDSQRRIFIPCYDDFYNIAMENLRLPNPAPVIADLGAGTGILSQKVKEKYPEAQIELIDVSDKMLAIAKERFAMSPGITIKIQDLSTLQLENSKYDAIVSSLAIHHLSDTEKIELYKKIFYGLKDGGIFINAEQVLADNPYLKKIYQTQWMEKIEKSDLSSEEIQAGYERAKLDIRTPLYKQLKWLSESGFRYTDCPYKYYDFAVIWAQK